MPYFLITVTRKVEKQLNIEADSLEDAELFCESYQEDAYDFQGYETDGTVEPLDEKPPHVAMDRQQIAEWIQVLKEWGDDADNS